ncbi:ABC transporter-like [Syntrophomonas zehnderi OL-4]|uniref:ABC transporter-like n=1 Tax=Syntrophomonas zehnderi OL-4 TaxID=690567 RepID=A0A0E4C8I8_9FIRM|nr:ABC transporter ATP-binding protein [Syntrophomonas zehnderi]CFX51905.1 ABC transporter-like [Syntrophomonas zehnderi OL-4]
MKIEVNQISKSLGGMHTLDEVSLNLNQGEFVVLIGPSGCGKSTLFNIIAGLIEPDQGSISIDGQDWTGKTGRISYMQQKDLLLPSRNILDNVSIPLVLKGMSKKAAREQAVAFLKDFGLEGFGNYYPRQLSGGMRQRAALLRTYLQASDILLLDEPFAALDAISRRSMQIWLKELSARYTASVLFITHDIEESLLLADRIYLFTARPARVKMEIDLQNKDYDQMERLQLKEEILVILEEENRTQD